MRQLGTILSSETFKNSSRLSRFLRYVVEQSLSGRTALKERRIGVDVFDRDDSYDTRADPVVRVEARQLRFKLAEYYAKFGTADEILISLPKGGYAPSFEPRLPIAAESSGSAANDAVHSPNRNIANGEQPLLETRDRPPRRARWERSLSTWRAPWKRIVFAAVMTAAALLFVFAYFPIRNPLFPGVTAGSSEGLAPSAANIAARDLYLKGRYYWNKRTPDGLTQAVDYFTQAIVRDPAYTQAYVGLADSYNLLSEFTSMRPGQAFVRASAAARRAVELDDSSAEAHNALAFASFWGLWDTATASREFQRALALNPNYALAHHWYATYLLTLGRIPDSLAEIERAQELNPISASVLADKGLILFYAGRQREAVASLKQLELTDPEFLSSHHYLRDIALSNKDYPTYAAEARQTASLSHDPGALAIADAAQKGLLHGNGRAVLQSILQGEKRLYAQGLIQAYPLAQICALMGQKQAAFEYLQRAFDQRESGILALRIDFLVRSLHGDPRYDEMLKKVGLPALN